MPQKKPTLRVQPKKGFFGRVKEMIGRVTRADQLFKFNARYDIYGASPSVDYSKTNYTLTRAVYYASEVADPVSGSKQGAKFLFGAVFGKPIVNAAAAFAIGRMPAVDVSPANENGELSKKEENTEYELIEFIRRSKNHLFKAVRNSYRDGDSYVRMRDTGEIELVRPDGVDKVYDSLTGDLLGYDIKHYVEDETSGSKSVIKYVEKLRKLTPYREVYEIKDGKEKIVTEHTEAAAEGEAGEERPLPLIHFPNEQEPSMLYGISEYQTCYYLMANYHAVLEKAIKGNIYNSTPVPVAKGIEDMDAFIAQNFDKNDDGEYEIKWGTDKFILGGKDFSIDMVTGDDTTAGADTLLKILFRLICQTSETPEFLMGTAVKSSNASVTEQMPALVKKAERKQGQLEEPLKELLELYLYYKRDDTELSIDVDAEFSIEWLPIIEREMKVNIEIVKLLIDNGSITDETAIKLLNLEGKIKDPAKEVEEAHKESETKVSNSGVFKEANEMGEGKFREELEKIGGTVSEMVNEKNKKGDVLLDDLIDLRGRLNKIMEE